MRRLIFGCGYLGRRVARKWKAAGDQVFAVTRNSQRAGEFRRDGFEPILADVTDRDSLTGFPEIDTVLFAVAYDRQSGTSRRDVYVDGIARALATNPQLLLADEATSALDPDTTQEVLGLLRRVNRELGITIVVITHEMDVVRSLAHRVVVMEAGRIVEEGPVVQVLSDPREPVTRRFVSTIVDGEPDAEALAALHARHAGRFVTLAFRDDVRQSDVFAVLLDHGVRFELVYGGIEEVQGATFGNLTLALDGDPAAVDAAVDAVRALVPTKELAR